jgi:hypothetical protein
MKFSNFYLLEESGNFYHGSLYSFNKFDMNKIGTGDGLNKYGFGLYFAQNYELAEYYARENFLPKSQKNAGMNMYEVKLNGLEDFYHWDELIPEELYFKIADRLEIINFKEDAKRMRDEFEGYNETYTMNQTYDILRSTVGSDKEATEFLNNLGVNGTISNDIQGRGKIFVAFNDNLIKIIKTWNLKDKI